jgi:hypothetical protein
MIGRNYVASVALAQVTRNSRVAYANLTYTEGVAQIGSVADAITDFGQIGKTYVTNIAQDEKSYTDAAAPTIGARTLVYTQADNVCAKRSRRPTMCGAITPHRRGEPIQRVI